MRTISMILIVSTCYFFSGCYNTLHVSNHDEIHNMLGEKKGICGVRTRSSEKYNFYNHEYDYVFEQDTLYGSAKLMTSDPWQKFEKIQIPVNEIANIEVQEIDGFRTGLLLLLSGVGIFLFVSNNELISIDMH